MGLAGCLGCVTLRWLAGWQAGYFPAAPSGPNTVSTASTVLAQGSRIGGYGSVVARRRCQFPRSWPPPRLSRRVIATPFWKTMYDVLRAGPVLYTYSVAIASACVSNQSSLLIICALYFVHSITHLLPFFCLCSLLCTLLLFGFALHPLLCCCASSLFDQTLGRPVGNTGLEHPQVAALRAWFSDRLID